MPHPFDAANRHLTHAYPGDWLALAGFPPGQSVQIVDANLSAVSSAADKIIKVNGPSPYGAHHEFQSGPGDELDIRVLIYNVLAQRQLKMHVKSAVFAFRPEALAKGVTGGFSDTLDPDHEPKFGHKLIRVWKIPSKVLLEGGLGTLSLVPISAVAEAELPAVIEAMAKRFSAEATPAEVGDL